jgi:predicted ATPase
MEQAFPEREWSPRDDVGGFQLLLTHAGLRRQLKASELSDGTLRFFCLAAALLSPKPPPLLVLNEPENSLHQGLLEPLAALIAQVPQETQLILVTHSPILADLLVEKCDAKKLELSMDDGRTRLQEHVGKGKIWAFD